MELKEELDIEQILDKYIKYLQEESFLKNIQLYEPMFSNIYLSNTLFIHYRIKAYIRNLLSGRPKIALHFLITVVPPILIIYVNLSLAKSFISTAYTIFFTSLLFFFSLLLFFLSDQLTILLMCA